MNSHGILIVSFLALISGSKNTNSLEPPFYEPNTLPDRSCIVHLFEWKWLDIAQECEEVLAPKGYAAVQVSSPIENLIVRLDNGDRPWWERFQPTSYRLRTRSGNEEEFAEMTRRCNQVGVRVYAHLVINHMAANASNTVGTGGSGGNSIDMDYPEVPYNLTNFHRPMCLVNDYQDAINVRNCELLGLHDLDHAQPYVQDKIIELVNHLIDLGVAGFLVDAAKHMWPQEILLMMEGAKALNTAFGFPPDTKPFVYQEVTDLGGEAVSYHEYTYIGRVLDFRHSASIGRVFSGDDQLRWLRNWGTEWGLVYGPLSVVFVDNHYNQRRNNEHGPILTYKRPREYKMAVAFMLAHPNAIPLVMSSYFFDDWNQGPPMTPEEELISPKFNYRGECINGYVCEHRWRQIANMVGFRVAADVTTVENWWDNGNEQIAFSRGSKAFIAFNNEVYPLDQTLPTGLPGGIYCDVISGDLTASGYHCSGKEVTVDANGLAHIVINPNEEDGVLAIHINARTIMIRQEDNVLPGLSWLR